MRAGHPGAPLHGADAGAARLRHARPARRPGSAKWRALLLRLTSVLQAHILHKGFFEGTQIDGNPPLPGGAEDELEPLVVKLGKGHILRGMELAMEVRHGRAGCRGPWV